MKAQQIEQQIKKVFQKENPISLNGSSFYLKDYNCLNSGSWLRSQTINALNLLHKQQNQRQISKIVELKCKSEEQKIKTFQAMKEYVRIIDTFLITMILFTENIEILSSIKEQNIFCQNTKYLLFPVNTQLDRNGQGNHWFVLLFRNPMYMKQLKQKSNLYIFNSIPNNTKMPVLNQIKKKIHLLLKLFHNFTQIQIQIKQVKNLPYQQNSFDCGIYTVAFTQFILQISLIQVQQKLNKIKQKDINQKLQVTLKSSAYLRNNYKQKIQQEILKKIEFQDQNKILEDSKSNKFY